MIAADPAFIQSMKLVRSAVVNRAAARAYRLQGDWKTSRTLARLANKRNCDAMNMVIEGLAPLAHT